MSPEATPGTESGWGGSSLEDAFTKGHGTQERGVVVEAKKEKAAGEISERDRQRRRKGRNRRNRNRQQDGVGSQSTDEANADPGADMLRNFEALIDRQVERQERKNEIKPLTTAEVAVLLSELNSAGLIKDSFGAESLDMIREKVKKAYDAIDSKKIIDLSAPITEDENSDHLANEAYVAGVKEKFDRYLKKINEIIRTKQMGPEIDPTKESDTGQREQRRITGRERRKMSRTIDSVFELQKKSNDELKEMFVDPEKKNDSSKVEAELAKINKIINLFNDPSFDIDIQFEESANSQNADEADEKLNTKDGRKKAVFDDLMAYQQRIGKIRKDIVETREKDNRFADARTFDDILRKIESIPYDSAGGILKSTIVSEIERIKDMSDEEFQSLAQFIDTFKIQDGYKGLYMGHPINLQNGESITKREIKIPEAFGILDAVAKVCDAKIAEAREKMRLVKEEEEQKIKTKKREDRKVFSGNVANYKFASIDQALDQPGFAQFLTLCDERLGTNFCVQALEQGDETYIKTRFEEYAHAREVEKNLEEIFLTEVSKDFGKRIQIPASTFDDMSDYILECAITDPEILTEMVGHLRNAKQLPLQITAAENTLEKTYKSFGGKEAFEVAEGEYHKKEEELERLRVHIGESSWWQQNKEVRKLIEDGIIRPSEFSTLERLWKGPAELIKIAAERIQKDVEFDKERIEAARVRIEDITVLKTELAHMYNYAKHRVFTGFTAASLAREGVESYVKNLIFKDGVEPEQGRGRNNRPETQEEKEERTQKDLENAEKLLAATRELKNKKVEDSGTPSERDQGNIDSIDDRYSIQYMSNREIEEAEIKIKQRVRRALQVKIEEAFEKVDLSSASLSSLEHWVNQWIFRPPQIIKKEKKKQGKRKGGNNNEPETETTFETRAVHADKLEVDPFLRTPSLFSTV
jgi:hypothetical protein